MIALLALIVLLILLFGFGFGASLPFLWIIGIILLVALLVSAAFPGPRGYYRRW